jgi:hypothetical protein
MRTPTIQGPGHLGAIGLGHAVEHGGVAHFAAVALDDEVEREERGANWWPFTQYGACERFFSRRVGAPVRK